MKRKSFSILHDALSQSLRRSSHGFTYRELSETRIQLICVLVHAILFDNRIPQWDLFEPKQDPRPDVDPFISMIERWGNRE